MEGVDLVDTLAAVQAGAVGALVRIDLAELPFVTWPISKGGPRGRRIEDTVRSIFAPLFSAAVALLTHDGNAKKARAEITPDDQSKISRRATD